jgi:hypothetical protein
MAFNSLLVKMRIKPEPTPARPTVYTNTCPSKSKIQISYQRLKEGWLETNFLIVSAVQENEVAFLEADPKERD